MTRGVSERSASAPLDLSVPAEPSSLPAIRRAVSDAGAAAGMPAHRMDDVLVAVTEACTNAIVHAYQGRAPGPVHVRVAGEDGALGVEVRDEGRGLLPRLRHTSPGLRLGLRMIAAVADEVRFSAPPGGGTSVSMLFARDGQSRGR